MLLRYKPLPLLTLTLLVSLLFIASCKKENSGTSNPNEEEVTASQLSSESDAQAEVVFNNVFDDAMGVNDQVALGGTGVFGRINSCPTVTITPVSNASTFPVRVVLDFGTGCTAPDGHFRKGKVITVYTNRLMIPGAVAETSFDGFYFDSIHVEGTHRIENAGTGPATTPTTRKFIVDITNGKLTRPSGNYVKWNSHKEISQTEGLSTPNIALDDIFAITGSANGQVLRGNLLVGWESNITTPLVKRFNCHWIVKGVIRTVRVNTPANGPWVAELNFGAGTCDNQAVVTINGVAHQITLP